MKKIWDGEFYCNNDVSRKSGVAILFKKEICKNSKEIYKDNEGRILGIRIMNKCFFYKNMQYLFPK